MKVFGKMDQIDGTESMTVMRTKDCELVDTRADQRQETATLERRHYITAPGLEMAQLEK